MISPVKGTHDIYGLEEEAMKEVEEAFEGIASLFGYRRIIVPTLESTELFDRGTGESSDVVRKEMYTFEDKGGRSLTLRPELTAGVARAVLTNKLYTGDLPLKYYYDGSAFRYERPQAGRYREFHTFGLECIGEDTAYLDAETVILATMALGYLGFKDLRVKVNSLGDKESRLAYREALKNYFAPHLENMCEDCKERFKLNPLRILDCKVEADQELAKGAPRLSQFLSKDSERRFYDVLSILNAYEIDYEIDEGLVRGLDYYSGFVYEIHASSPKGAALGALLGGGHYDSLLETIGGPSLPGVGFGAGLERIAKAYLDSGLLHSHAGLDCYVVPLGEESYEDAFGLVSQIRSLGYKADLPPRAVKLTAAFKRAERAGARFVLILGENEREAGKVQIKDQRTKNQEEVLIEDLAEYLDERMMEDEDHA